MSEELGALRVIERTTNSDRTAEIDVLILATGFEDRAFHLLDTATFKPEATCVLIRYKNDVLGNRTVFERYSVAVGKKFKKDKVLIVDLTGENIEKFSADLHETLKKIDSEARSFGLDISGMTSYCICIALRSARQIRPFEKQIVFYTSANEYVPTYSDFLALKKKLSASTSDNEIDYLPKSMALEMSDNLVLDAFSGHRSGDGKACLVLFAGYEVHRSSGTIDATNPSLLVLLYGKPADPNLTWRLELSKSLHAKFQRSRRCATEEVSTLQIQESLDALEHYYNYLIDEHDLIIAPVCSKMHTVAAFLFWERYGEVQLTFPLPIGYNPENRPRGVGSSYFLEIYEPRMFYRNAIPQPAAIEA